MKTLDTMFIRAYARDDDPPTTAARPRRVDALPADALRAGNDTKSLQQAFPSTDTLFASAASDAGDPSIGQGPWVQSAEWVLAPAHADCVGANVEIASQPLPSTWPIPVAAAPNEVVASANRTVPSKSSSPGVDTSEAGESKASESKAMESSQAGVDRKSHSATQRRVTLGTIIPVRVDEPQGIIKGPHFRVLPQGSEEHTSGDANRRSVKLEPLMGATKFTPAWEVDEFGWSAFSKQLAREARESFQAAGTYLRSACREGLHVLAITSAARSAGRTSTALGIARAVAASGVRAAILDADLDQPALAMQLGLHSTCGWQEVILDRMPLEEVSVYSIADRITAIPLARSLADRLPLDDPRVTTFVQQLTDYFDLVVVDMGPVGSSERRMFEAGVRCPVDAAIVVRDLRVTDEENEYAIGARLRAAGVKSVGIVENFARAA